MAGKKVQLFFASKDKYQRAVKIAKNPKKVKGEYLKLGGLIVEGQGFIEVK